MLNQLKRSIAYQPEQLDLVKHELRWYIVGIAGITDVAWVVCSSMLMY